MTQTAHLGAGSQEAPATDVRDATDVIEAAAGQAAGRPAGAAAGQRPGASRRAFLAGTVAVAGVGALAACAPGDEAGGSGTSGGGTDGTDGTASAAPSATGLVALADVPVGGAVAATTSGGDAVLVTQPEAGTVRCFSSVCTHQGCAVAPGEGALACPCHGSMFDLDTGDPIEGPATEALGSVAVEVKDGQVVEA